VRIANRIVDRKVEGTTGKTKEGGEHNIKRDLREIDK
jgi:hypothetical protein